MTVLVKGTTTGSTSGTDGRFSVQAAPGATLVFSFIGLRVLSVRPSSAGSNARVWFEYRLL